MKHLAMFIVTILGLIGASPANATSFSSEISLQELIDLGKEENQIVPSCLAEASRNYFGGWRSVNQKLFLICKTRGFLRVSEKIIELRQRDLKSLRENGHSDKSYFRVRETIIARHLLQNQQLRYHLLSYERGSYRERTNAFQSLKRFFELNADADLKTEIRSLI